MALSEDERAALRSEIADLRRSSGSEHVFVALWRYVPGRDDDDHLAALPLRLRYLAELAERGLVWASGPLSLDPEDDDAPEGMTMLTVDSFTAARALLDAEPTVQRGLRTYQLFRWQRAITR